MIECNYKSIEDLQKNKISSTACKLCIPYIELYIREKQLVK